MRQLKQAAGGQPKVSLVLLDWKVRESFHLLHYLKHQSLPRNSFEVILIEFYDYVSDKVRPHEDQLDTWVTLGMPDDCYYHKHLMYNVGVLLSRGEVVTFCDSDAMVHPTFIETIITKFDRDPQIVHHMDEFRNVRRDLYPFRYPSFETVLGEGCINNADGTTRGMVEEFDRTHARNYGACMSARREDIIAIGGADEDFTYLGHVCGPYDMSFRLMNSGRRLVWDRDEYLYHTWHPGSDGLNDLFGPNDGLNMSTTAFSALCAGRVLPLIENQAIAGLRLKQVQDHSQGTLERAVNPEYRDAFRRGPQAPKTRPGSQRESGALYGTHRGHAIFLIDGTYYGVPMEIADGRPAPVQWRHNPRVIQAESFSVVIDEIERWNPKAVEVAPNGASIYTVDGRFAIVPLDLGKTKFYDPEWRADPRIVWSDTLAGLRQRCNALLGEEYVMADQPVGQPGTRVASRPPYTTGDTALRIEVARLAERVAELEQSVAAIYESRIWRTLVRLGGLITKIRG